MQYFHDGRQSKLFCFCAISTLFLHNMYMPWYHFRIPRGRKIGSQWLPRGNNEISLQLSVCVLRIFGHTKASSALHSTRYAAPLQDWWARFDKYSGRCWAGGWVRLGDPLHYQRGQDVCNSQLAKTTHWISHACKWGTTTHSQRAKWVGVIMSPALFNFAEETQTQMKWNGSPKAGGALFLLPLPESVFLFVNVCNACVLASASVFFSLGQNF